MFCHLQTSFRKLNVDYRPDQELLNSLWERGKLRYYQWCNPKIWHAHNALCRGSRNRPSAARHQPSIWKMLCRRRRRHCYAEVRAWKSASGNWQIVEYLHRMNSFCRIFLDELFPFERFLYLEILIPYLGLDRDPLQEIREFSARDGHGKFRLVIFLVLVFYHA